MKKQEIKKLTRFEEIAKRNYRHKNSIKIKIIN